MNSLELEKNIEQERNTIRTDKLDIAYGQLAAMYKDEELKIDPEYQRLYPRWELGQKTKFIESILLGFPIPAIFVAETENGVWELVDGLQRLGTLFEFMGVLKSVSGGILPPLRLSHSEGKNILPGLNGATFEELTLKTKLTIKRTPSRVEVIQARSGANIKYEVFERLNTGGTTLEPQEIRNCIFRANSPVFMKFIDDLAEFPEFKDHLGLSGNQLNSMYDKGLVLRFFTLKNNYENFKHDVEPFITEYTRSVVDGSVEFDYVLEDDIFKKTFAKVAEALGDDAWRWYKDEKFKGPFSPYLFETIAVAVARSIRDGSKLEPGQILERSNNIKTNKEFKENTGSGANHRTKFLSRMKIAHDFINGDRNE